MMATIRDYETYSSPAGEQIDTAPPVGENIMGNLLTLIYRYQDARRANEESQKAEAESSARMLALVKEIQKALMHAYENDEVTRILVQAANAALRDPTSRL